MRRANFLCAVCALAVAGGVAASNDNIGGFSEAVVSVAEFAAHLDFYEGVAGWEVVASGTADPRFESFWRLEPAGPIQQVLLRNPGTETGYVRLLRYPQDSRQPIRSNDQAWDTGGIFDLNLRVADMDAALARLRALHWQATSDPLEFTFGRFRVKEWIVRGPDGVRYAFIERVAPRLVGWPHMRQFSRVFNSTQIVRDIEAARSFYVDKLGFDVYLESSQPSPVPGPNVLGLPHNLAAEISRQVYIVHPAKTNHGSVEILQFAGATGTDFAARAVPPNIGVLSLRFPVRDLDRLLERLREHGIEIMAGPATVTLPPHGNVRIVAIRSPDGAWLEFFQQAD